jgi:hypothetical protein
MNIKRKIIAGLAAVMLVSPAWADKPAAKSAANAPSYQQIPAGVDKSIKEAAKALELTVLALKQLDEGQKDKAIKTLAAVTGQLEIIIAQHPELAFAPIDSQVLVVDYQGDKDTVKAIRKDATKLLKDGRLQEARLLIKDIASEIVISTRALPLATYPDVIKSVVPMIDKGDIALAKVTLEQALSTVVVTQDVIPLPVLRASTALAEAKALANKDKRVEKENQSLKALLAEARQQLEWAEILGYGDKNAYKPLYKAIKDIDEKTSNGSDGQSLFDKLKAKVKQLTEK